MIVVVMLGILAAIVVPRLVNASAEARESAVLVDLSTMRRQIQRYKLDHAERGPHLDASGALDPDNMVARLTGRTDDEGKLDPAGAHGPYLIEWPTNPFSKQDVAANITFGAQPNPPRSGNTGWYYCTVTCIISANSAQGGESFDPPAK